MAELIHEPTDQAESAASQTEFIHPQTADFLVYVFGADERFAALTHEEAQALTGRLFDTYLQSAAVVLSQRDAITAQHVTPDTLQAGPLKDGKLQMFTYLSSCATQTRLYAAGADLEKSSRVYFPRNNPNIALRFLIRNIRSCADSIRQINENVFDNGLLDYVLTHWRDNASDSLPEVFRISDSESRVVRTTSDSRTMIGILPVALSVAHSPFLRSTSTDAIKPAAISEPVQSPSQGPTLRARQSPSRYGRPVHYDDSTIPVVTQEGGASADEIMAARRRRIAAAQATSSDRTGQPARKNYLPPGTRVPRQRS